MKKLLVTSSRFAGQAECIYNDAGVMIKMDCSSCNMDWLTMQSFLDSTPGHFGNIEHGWKGFKPMVVLEDYQVSLADFVQEYPYKRNMHLLPVRWEKLTKTEQVQAWMAAKEYRQYLKRNTWQKPRIADAWLKDKEFLNNWKIL